MCRKSQRLHIQNRIARINKFSKVSGYKISTQKLVAFLYTNNEQSEKEIQKLISFTIALKGIKHLGINLTKYAKDLHTENLKMLLTEILKAKINGYVYSLWIGRLNSVNMTILTKVNCRSMESISISQ